MSEINADLNSDLKVALNDFALNFLKCYHQTGNKNRNLFYSSISLANALSLLISGASGRTKQELVDHLLGYSDSKNGLMNEHTLEVVSYLVNEEVKKVPMNTLEVTFKKVRFHFVQSLR